MIRQQVQSFASSDQKLKMICITANWQKNNCRGIFAGVFCYASKSEGIHTPFALSSKDAITTSMLKQLH